MNQNEMHINALEDKIYHETRAHDETKYFLNHEINKLKAENARYREALEFYAESWERGDYNGDLMVRKIGSYDAFEEVHERAREALKEE